MVGRGSVFAVSYRLCVPELKSVGWQCPIFGQLVGTRQIQDGQPGKLQNEFIFPLQHAINILLVSTRILWRMRNTIEPFLIISNYVHIIKIQNGRHFRQLQQKSSITELIYAIYNVLFTHCYVLLYQKFVGIISCNVRLKELYSKWPPF